MIQKRPEHMLRAFEGITESGAGRNGVLGLTFA